MNGKERITDCPAVNTGQWYHIGVSWRSWDGDWRIYINGKPSDGGKGLSVGTTIPGVVLSSAWTLFCHGIFLNMKLFRNVQKSTPHDPRPRNSLDCRVLRQRHLEVETRTIKTNLKS